MDLVRINLYFELLSFKNWKKTSLEKTNAKKPNASAQGKI